MNCKQGDLAVIVRSDAGNEGKVVRCVELVPNMEFFMPNGKFSTSPGWRIDRPLRGWCGDVHHFALDSYLRPIRDSDGDDETLTWAGKPQEVTA